jgi:hypothetical protein
MYDQYIRGGKFGELKGSLNNLINGASDEDIDEIAERIQEAHDNNQLSGTQYDNLMSLVQDLT